MRVVVTGAGAVGRHLAADLADRGHDVTLIDQSPDVVDKAREWAPKVNVLLGDACEPWVLERAELSKAEVVVAATGDDEDNLVTSLLAKQEFAVPRVLARVNHPKNEWLFTEQWGVDAAVSPPHILTAMVEEAVTVGDLVRLIRLEGGRISIVEMTLPDASPSVGRPLYELRLPPDSAVVAILRDGHVVIPQPETVFSAGRRGRRALLTHVGVRAADRDRGRRDVGQHATHAGRDRRRRPDLAAPSDRALRRFHRHPQHPVALQHQRQLVGERSQDPAIGHRELARLPSKHQDAEVAAADVQRQAFDPRSVGRERHGARLAVDDQDLVQSRCVAARLDRTTRRRGTRSATPPVARPRRSCRDPVRARPSALLRSWSVRSSRSRASAASARDVARAMRTEISTERPRKTNSTTTWSPRPIANVSYGGMKK